MKRTALAVYALGLFVAGASSARAADNPPAPTPALTGTPPPDHPVPEASIPEQTAAPVPPPSAAPAPEPAEAAKASDPEASAQADDVSAPDPIPDEDLEMPLIAPHREGQSGHFRLALGGAFAAPFGSFHQDLKESDRIAQGFAGYAAATIGVSPSVALGLGADLAFFSGSDTCPSCSATSIGLGPRVVYHLVQGTRFDPWTAVGIGYRTTTLDLGSTSESYAGIEWLHLEVGGDWYPSPYVGLGPFMLINSGIYASRPENTERAMYWSFLVGFRALLHAPGRADSSSE